MSGVVKPRILFFNPVRHAVGVYKALSDTARTEVVASKSREEFFEDVKGKYNDVRAIWRTSYSGAVSCVEFPNMLAPVGFRIPATKSWGNRSNSTGAFQNLVY